jgi:hypothetical protein
MGSLVFCATPHRCRTGAVFCSYNGVVRRRQGLLVRLGVSPVTVCFRPARFCRACGLWCLQVPH